MHDKLDGIKTPSLVMVFTLLTPMKTYTHGEWGGSIFQDKQPSNARDIALLLEEDSVSIDGIVEEAKLTMVRISLSDCI